MAKRYDICTPRKNGDKTYWTRIGSAWQNDKGIQLVFDALPIPDAEGRCVANLFEPKSRDDRGGGSVSNNSRNQSQNSGWGADDLNDDIPF